MIRIDVLTTTRAEYGLMRPLLKRLNEDPDFDFRLLITGTHLSNNFGSTYKEIERDGFSIQYSFDIMSDDGSSNIVSKMMSRGIEVFGSYFSKNKPDFLLVDGDRYETCAICLAAYSNRIPIIHLGGGDTTEGALDDAYRHCITKMSFLHFPTNQIYANRIIQLGEEPQRVYNVGSLSIENIINTKIMSIKQLSNSLHFELDAPFAVATFHPVTLEDGTAEKQIEALLQACNTQKDMKFIITGANADNGGDKINDYLRHYVRENNKFIFIDSLGTTRYISALRHCEFVIGNSSSGITEAPSLHIPTINIGDRQKGRIQADSTINCLPIYNEIVNAINVARSNSFKEMCKHVKNPNGDGVTSIQICNFIKEAAFSNSIDLKKHFFDVNYKL